MGDISDCDRVKDLHKQLIIARTEIKNLRQQMQSLRHAVRNDVTNIEESVKNFHCENCRTSESVPSSSGTSNKSEFPVIGVISSWFAEKRGVPRQSGICSNTKGIINLDPNVINNPEYALEGLEEFSHMWIIFHFHKHDSNHVRSKVAPPRLNGTRVGVYSTRSPHRPCPIGLSLVRIDKICGFKIYFSGVDMLDGTPVLDIKPYIPIYDDPTYIERRESLLEIESHDRSVPVGETIEDMLDHGDMEREVEGGVSDEESLSSQRVQSVPQVDLATSLQNMSISSQLETGETREEALAEGREAPDGEEGSSDKLIRVPNWITNPTTSKLQVLFNDRANSQLHDNILKNTIISVLKEDPRSVYLRKKLGNQFYTFLIQDLHVSCKFDDSNNIVTVYQVRRAGTVCECGSQELQCSCQLHN